MKYEYKIAVHKSNQAECGEEAETGLCVTLEEKQCDTVELRECLEVEEERCEEVECELVVDQLCTEPEDCRPGAQVSCVVQEPTITACQDQDCTAVKDSNCEDMNDPNENCKLVDLNDCDFVTENECSAVEKEECVEGDLECNTITEEECTDNPEVDCIAVTKMNCSITSEDSCDEVEEERCVIDENSEVDCVGDQNCKIFLLVGCENVTMRECEQLGETEVCRKTLETVCIPSREEICTDVQKSVCEEVTECKKVEKPLLFSDVANIPVSQSENDNDAGDEVEDKATNTGVVTNSEPDRSQPDGFIASASPVQKFATEGGERDLSLVDFVSVSLPNAVTIPTLSSFESENESIRRARDAMQMKIFISVLDGGEERRGRQAGGQECEKVERCEVKPVQECSLEERQVCREQQVSTCTLEPTQKCKDVVVAECGVAGPAACSPGRCRLARPAQCTVVETRSCQPRLECGVEPGQSCQARAPLCRQHERELCQPGRVCRTVARQDCRAVQRRVCRALAAPNTRPPSSFVEIINPTARTALVPASGCGATEAEAGTERCEAQCGEVERCEPRPPQCRQETRLECRVVEREVCGAGGCTGPACRRVPWRDCSPLPPGPSTLTLGPGLTADWDPATRCQQEEEECSSQLGQCADCREPAAVCDHLVQTTCRETKQKGEPAVERCRAECVRVGPGQPQRLACRQVPRLHCPACPACLQIPVERCDPGPALCHALPAPACTQHCTPGWLCHVC